MNTHLALAADPGSPVRRGDRWVFPDGSTVPVIRGGDGPVEPPAVPDDLASLDADALASLEADLVSAFDALHDSGDADLASLTAVGESIKKVRAESKAREEAAEADAAAIAALAAEVHGSDTDGDDTDGDDDEDEDDEDGDDGDGGADDATDPPADDAGATDKADDKELVTASAGKPAKVQRGKASARAAAGAKRPTVPAARPEVTLTAAADLASHSAGTKITPLEIAEALHDKARALSPRPGAPRVAVARVGVPLPATDWLNGNQEHDTTIINRVANAPQTVDALVAAGGWCTPSNTLYDLFDISGTGGLLDLPTVGVTRGGVSIPGYIGPEAADDALWTWTEDLDANTQSSIASVVKVDGVVTVNTTDAHSLSPGSTVVINVGSPEYDGTWVVTSVPDADTFTYDMGTGATDDDPGTGLVGTASAVKGCFQIPCPEWTDWRLVAEGVCLTHGNLSDRAFPELTRHFTNKVMNAHERRISRLSVNRLLADDFTTAVTATAIAQTDAAGNLLSAVELQAEDYRSQHEMDAGAVLEVVMPVWGRAVLRANLAMRAGVDLLRVTNAMIDGYLAERGVRVQYVTQYQKLYSGAPATVWPTTIQFIIYPAGGFFKGVGGSIDLGVVRDSILNQTNDHTAVWTEQFYVVARRGPLGRRVTATINVTGATGCCDAV